MPTLSGDRRTYTFRIRPGYRFSPPSNQPVTAETFRYSIERALSPRLAEGPVVPNPPGPDVIDDIEGEQAFLDGTASHISGLRASGDTLSITLTRPSPDFLERLALPFFCPVPVGTPFAAGAPHREVPAGDGSIVSAGPYYVAYYGGDGYVILKRNPNYSGPRPHALDAIVIREDAAASAALDLVQNAGWDGITNLPDNALAPDGLVDQCWGPNSAAATNGDQRYFLTAQASTRYIAFNASRGPFADPRIRRAAALALDRTALAAAWEEAPTDQLLSPAFRGYERRPTSRLRPSVARARERMHGRSLRAVLPIPTGCAPCSQAARLVHRDLALIGIDVKIRPVGNLAQALTAGSRFDLLDTGSAVLYPDAASFLEQMLVDMPSGWIPAHVEATVHHVADLNGDDRQGAAAALADRIVTDEVSVAPYATAETSQIVGPGVGCRVFTPFSYGLDLAALCAK
jgi:peptide/nickel transport system substrate-binding protein